MVYWILFVVGRFKFYFWGPGTSRDVLQQVADDINSEQCRDDS